MKLNKIICFTLALILSVSMALIPVSAEAGSGTSEIEFLSELGIVKGYEDGELHPEYNITRMEYAALIIRCLGYDGDYPSIENVFTDVPKESWGAAAVQFAYDLGIINGYGDGTFGPDDNILEVDAVKIIVSALGRRLEAENQGGYPTGYLSIAQKLKLLKDYKGGEALATRGFVATLIANALDVSIVEQNFTSNAFMEIKGRTILSILGISRYEGVLTAVSGTNIDSRENVLPDEVVISGRKFKTDEVFSNEYVAESIIAYIQNYGETGEKLIAMFTANKDNKNITVNSKDIMPSTNLKKFVYIKDNKEKELELPTSLSIVYNGTLIDSSVNIVPERLKPVNGTVKLIDTDDNKIYDMAIVKEYATYVVKAVTEDAIYDIYGNAIELDVNEENSAITVIKDGKIGSWEDITAGSVLSIASNIQKNVVEIIICDEILNDVAISTATRDGVLYYGFESGNELKTTKEYNSAFSKNYREALEIELGMKYKLRLNSFGEIAVVEEYVPESDDEEIVVRGKEIYGFLCTAAPDNTAMTENLEVRILTKNNLLEIFTISGENAVRFGRMVSGSYRVGKATPSEIYAGIKGMDGRVERQVVKYVLGEDGTIRELYLRDKNAKVGSATLSMDSGRSNHTFSYSTVMQKWYFDENTTLFMLTGNGDRDTDIICTTPGGYLSNRSTHNSELWDVDSDGYINCICLYPATGETVNSSESVFVLDVLNDPIMVVTHVGEEVNDEGIVYKIVEGYEDGRKVRTLVSDGLSKIATIRPGMVIQYATNQDTLKYAYYAEDDVVMLGYQEMFDCGDNNEQFVFFDHKDKYSSGARMSYGFGTVTRVDYPALTISARNLKTIIHDGTSVLKYHSGTGAFEKVDSTQIIEGQKVFFRTRLDNLREIIIMD